MPLSQDHDANVAQLMEWLRSERAPADAVQLRDELAYLLFYGDPTWAYNQDSGSISDYRSILAGWLTHDSGEETRFIELTAPGISPDGGLEALVRWFTPVVENWKQWAKDTEGNVEKGLENPGFAADQTPGTEYYWYDPDNEVYLYASSADAPDNEWLSYEDRRYTPIARDDARRTNFRQDVVTREFEFQSKITPSRWLSSAQWDQEVAAASGQADASAAVDLVHTVPVYDAGFAMYRRFNSVQAAYEYSDDPAAGIWLSVQEATDKLTVVVPGVAGASVVGAGVVGAEAVAEQRQVAARTVYEQIVLPALNELDQSRHPAVLSLLSQDNGRERLRAEVMRATAQLAASGPPS